MIEIRFWQADDGKRFESEYECNRYERKTKLEMYKDDFVFYDEQKNIIIPEEADTEEVSIIVVKTPAAAEYIGEWFESDGYYSPFDGCEFGHEVGTWVCGELVEMGDEWVKLEAEIERLQNFLAEIQ
jgi:hypothetical protein